MIKRPSRITLVGAAFVLAAIAIVVRAVEVQLLHGDSWRRRAAEQQTVKVELPAPRGAIYDRNGVAIALSQVTYGVGVAPKEVSDASRAAGLLAKALGKQRFEIARVLASDRVWVEWPGPYDWNAVAPLKSVRGVYLEQRLQRFYPRPDLAAGLIGRTDQTGHGASGLERALDSTLAGRPGSAVMLRDRAGHTYPSPSRPAAEPQSGEDVYLTLDAELEEIAERALATAVATTRASGGDVVILQPATGEILALSSIRQKAEEGSGLGDAFEPGSTAKLFTAAALLRTGKATAADTVFGENGHYVLNGRAIDDVHPNRELTLADVIRVSSNIGISKFSTRLTPPEQFEALRDFGFGTPTGIEIAGESPGRLRNPRFWTVESPASLAMGYEVAVTPLQLAAAYGALANGGVLLEPTLVREIRDADGTVRSVARARPARRAVSASIASQLIHMLQGVVEEGTGRSAALGTYSLAGKTGTPRRTVNGHYLAGHYTPNFVGLFPAQDPQLVLVVKLDDPQGDYLSGATAAPVVRSILEAALATPGVTVDRGRLAEVARQRRPVGPSAVPAGDTAAGSARAEEAAPVSDVVVSWPPSAAPPRDGARPRAVPDVAGLSLRAAARTLHQQGFEVRVEGWGKVAATSPEAGSAAPAGSTVTVRAGGAATGGGARR
ncbi:MAG: penicillin-binding transpeptidase domain-containing protein [Gemmatimonadales bacterium]